MIALSTGGHGMSQSGRKRLYKTTVSTERACARAWQETSVPEHKVLETSDQDAADTSTNGEITPRRSVTRSTRTAKHTSLRARRRKNAGSRKLQRFCGPFESAFPYEHTFLDALKGEQDRCLSEQKWRTTDIIEEGVSFPFVNRCLLGVDLDAMLDAQEVRLRGDVSRTTSGAVRRTGTLNSDVFLNEQSQVLALHDGKKWFQGKKLLAFVMAVQLFSDAAVVSENGAHKVYPIRARFPNVVTGKTQWITVGYLPVIDAETDDLAERERLRLLRDRVLQRCLAVLLHDLITASEHGAVFDLPKFGPVLAVPRITLYAADQPEERHLLGLMLSGCAFPCSHCMVGKAHAGSPHAAASPRPVVDMIDLHLEAADLWQRPGSGPRIARIAAEASVLPIVPALAAVHVLGTGSMSLYSIFGFDLLHVMKLGVLKNLADAVVALLKETCRETGLARYGTFGNSRVAINERIRHLGRLPKASQAAPGYFPEKGRKQMRLKGRQWRYGVMVWPFMVVGIVGARKLDSTAPCEGKSRRRQRSGATAAGPPCRGGRRSGGGRHRSRRVVSDDSGWETADEADDSGTGLEDTFDDEANDAAAAPRAAGASLYVSEAERKAECRAAFGDMPTHDAVLDVVCRAAALMGKLCGDNGAGEDGYTDETCEKLGLEAYRLVTTYMRVLFGDRHTTKMHALAYHLCDELMRRGSLVDADTSVNERLHKALKAFFANTNKHPTSFRVQMMRCEQTLYQVIAEDLKDQDDKDEKAADEETSDTDGGAASSDAEGDSDSDLERAPSSREEAAGCTSDDSADVETDSHEEEAPRKRTSKPRVYGRRTTVAAVMLADVGRLQDLPGLLGVDETARLVVTNTSKIKATLPWRRRRVKQLVRAAHDF